MYRVAGRVSIFICVCVLTLLVSSSISQSQAGGSSSDWKAIVQNRLPLYGHRNWIVVADSAFPVYAAPGIETIVTDEDLPSVLKYVASAISSSRHVRATVFLDQELQFVDEHDYPGIEPEIAAGRWGLVYWDDFCALYLRRSARYAAALGRRASPRVVLTLRLRIPAVQSRRRRAVIRAIEFNADVITADIPRRDESRAGAAERVEHDTTGLAESLYERF